ncbi:hypothetical protein AVEN_102245-1 [Araneus ventricosus]|uniref:Uncharacterized protein n=1 Tax=Araneus ventricosus TaxID=182803 RepID=A0A4Y2WQA2_ARAVE|nr:hypothetical protein AVEN_102245-1 [Araneus ventricosus]
MDVSFGSPSRLNILENKITQIPPQRFFNFDGETLDHSSDHFSLQDMTQKLCFDRVQGGHSNASNDVSLMISELASAYELYYLPSFPKPRSSFVRQRVLKIPFISRSNQNDKQVRRQRVLHEELRLRV